MMLIDRRLLINFDWSLLLLVLLICCMGVVLIYSASASGKNQIREDLHIKQALWIFIGLITMLIVVSIDYHHLVAWSPLLYSLDLLALLYVLLTSGGKVERWIRVFGINLQPSEFMKFFLILLLARILKDKKPGDLTLRVVALGFLLTLIPAILILKQPDLGTAILLIPLLFALLFIAGIPLKWIGIVFGLGLLVSPFLWHGLKPYQKNRILSFINPQLDPLGSGYQVIQSKIAVGSGGILGKGFKCGTQCRLKFIPQHHTDFIFTLLAEEWGFLGASITLILLAFLLLKGIDICTHAKDRIGTLIAYGLVFIIGFHIIVNVGMVIGIMPVTGIPLPFISYGGSALMGNFVGIGLLLNIKMRRFD